MLLRGTGFTLLKTISVLSKIFSKNANFPGLEVLHFGEFSDGIEILNSTHSTL